MLTAAALGLWLLLAGPAYLVAGVDGLEGLTYAGLLCLVPGWLVFVIAAKSSGAGQQMSMAILGGMGLRMVFVLVGLVVIQSQRPELQFREFVVWLLVFYRATVALETKVVVSRKNRFKSNVDESTQSTP